MCANDPLLKLTLPCEIGALASVHEPLEQMQMPEDPQVRADLHLVVWELLTNAVIHSGGAPNETVELQISDRGAALHVLVIDPGEGFKPRIRRPDAHRPNGRGLLIVDRLSSHWGVERSGGTQVWCEVPLTIAA